MIKLLNPVSFYDLFCIVEGSDFSEDEEILLTAVCSFLYYECCKEEHSLDNIIKILNCMDDPLLVVLQRSTFDFLFGRLLCKNALHPAITFYTAFSTFPAEKKWSTKETCLAKLKAFRQ